MTTELKLLPIQNGSSAFNSHKKEIIRHPDFSRHDEPLYFNQQVLNVLWIGKSHLFAIYACYLIFCPDLYPRSCFIFGNFSENCPLQKLIAKHGVFIEYFILQIYFIGI